MTTKLMRTSWVLAIPLALALVTTAVHAAAQQDPQEKTVTKKVTTTKSGNTTTRDATTVGPNGGVTVAHSVAEWHPSTGTKTTQTTRTTTRPAEPQHRHWWQRGHRAPPAQKAEEVKP